MISTETYFKRPYLSAGHFFMRESNEENTLLRLENVMNTTNHFTLKYVDSEL